MKSSTTVLSHNLSIITSPANHGPGDDGQCFHFPDAKFDVFHQRTETNLVTGVLNTVLSPFAVMANLLIVLIILTRKSLQSPCNILLACLAISDLQLGILVQPSYVALQTARKRARLRSLLGENALLVGILRLLRSVIHDIECCKL